MARMLLFAYGGWLLAAGTILAQPLIGTSPPTYPRLSAGA